MEGTDMSPFEEPKQSYVGAAFTQQYNVILLGGAALFSAASASFVPLAVGLAAEAAWLAVGPRLPSFRHWVDARAFFAAGTMGQQDPLVQSMETLDGEHNGRLLRLGALLGEIRGLASQARGPGGAELNAAVSELESVRPAFLRLCQLHQKLSLFVADPSVLHLETELSRLNESFAKEKDISVRLTLRQAITLVERRIEHRERMASVRRAGGLRLELIESSLSHVRSHGLTLSAPLDLAAEIRGLIQQVNSVSTLEQEAGDAGAASRPPTQRSAQAVSYPG
jgi:hypothetical protein